MRTGPAPEAGPHAGPDPVGRPRTFTLSSIPDARGCLVAGEHPTELPFVAARFFAIHSVPPGAERADHANRACDEVLVCLAGRCEVEVRRGRETTTFELDASDLALHVPRGLWLVCRRFSADAVLLVLASDAYDPSNQITDFDLYLEHVRQLGVS